MADLGTLHMPFDGYHIPLQELAKSDNNDDLIYRRGAPDTFDQKALYNDLHRIRYNVNETIVNLPSFCHSKGDPEPDAIQFNRTEHNIIICEGLYLLHAENGWDTIKDCFDLSVYVDANLNQCIDRLKIRNQMIPGYTPEEINIRVDAVDRLNAMYVEKSKSRADIIVQSAISS